jgi:hypothetical protein
MNTIEGFDALVDHGVAVEMRHSAPSNEIVSEGSRVKLQCSAMIWDGSTTETQVFSEGFLTFTLGKSQVTAGLEEAILKLHLDEEADIVCAPLMAYGDAGQPPVVPPNSHIVYSVKVLTISSDATEISKGPEGDSILFWTGISQRVAQGAAGHAITKKAGAVVLVTDEKSSAKKDTEITDEMLAAAAKGMGMK